MGGDPGNPRAEAWNRGAGKTSTVELVSGYLGDTSRRKFILYVSATQKVANQRTRKVASVLSKAGRKRQVNDYGASVSWRCDQLVTDHGFIFAGVGLDTAIRGIKFDDTRPDCIILDDFDDKNESEESRDKKIDLIRDSILLAGSNNCMVLIMQNLIYYKSIMDQLCGENPPFLYNRDVQIVKAAQNLTYVRERVNDKFVYRVTGGEPSWSGFDLKRIEADINKSGIRSFLSECQHEIDAPEGALWKQSVIDELRVTQLPSPIVFVAVGYDPAITSFGTSDESGIVSIAVCENGHYYVLNDLSGKHKISDAPRIAIQASDVYRGYVIYESNQGGDFVLSALQTVSPTGKYLPYHASDSKRVRAEDVLTLYDQGLVHHVGFHPQLEKEMTTWDPFRASSRSPNRIDALVLALKWLRTQVETSEETYSNLNTANS